MGFSTVLYISSLFSSESGEFFPISSRNERDKALSVSPPFNRPYRPRAGVKVYSFSLSVTSTLGGGG